MHPWCRTGCYHTTELELTTDMDKYLFIESSIRGEISQISTRYSQANNKYMREYNTNEQTKQIIYLDANNLYGWEISQYSPYKSF